MSPRRPLSRPVLVLAAFFALATPARAQALAVDGHVVDPTGAGVPAARVTVTADGGFHELVSADEAGHFRVEAPAGRYELVAERDGFAPARRMVDVRDGSTPTVRLTLRPARRTEEVTVVGSRILGGPESVRRIPGSLEVLDPETLETSRVRDVSEALRKASGVHVRDEEGFGLRPNISLRGLNPTRSSKTLLLEDGVPLSFAPYGDNASYYHPPVERFESVEILKGSGQIGYGPVTVGGVINYITPDPPASRSATLRLAGGNRDYLNGHLTAGTTLGRTGVLVDLMRKQGDGARDHVHSDLDDVTVKVVAPIGARHTLTFKGNFYGEDSQITYSGLRQDEYERDPRQNPFVNDDFTGRRFGLAARHSVVLGHRAVLGTQAYLSRFSRDWWRQSSNSGQRPNDAADPLCGGMANLLTTCGNEGRLRDYDTLGIEPRLRLSHGLLGIRAEAEAGARAHFEVQERRQENGDGPTARSGRRVEDNRRENEAYSAFVQERLLLGPVTVTPGIRFEHIRYERTNRLANAGAGVTGRTRVDQWVPGIGVAWSRDDRWALFGGIHRGFAPPRTEDIVNNTTGGTIDLDPERSWNAELGFRAAPRPGLRFDATAFRMDYENQIVPATLAGGVGATLTNGGATLHQGYEVGARVDSGTLRGSEHNLYVRAAFTAVPTARFDGVRFSSVSGQGATSVSGNRLPYAPRRTLTAAVGYARRNGLDLQVEAVSVSDQFADDLNTVRPSADGQRGLLPGYTVWNATAGHEVKALRSTLYVAVKNVLDELYIVDRSRGILPGNPRLFQVGLVTRF